jgi:4-hydroxy-3-polyprenylbenzoate decarboxylase
MALNSGSKLVVAAYGDKKRELGSVVAEDFKTLKTFINPHIVFDGVLIFKGNKFESYEKAKQEFEDFNDEVKQNNNLFSEFPLIVVADDSEFSAENLKNWLWVTFTRSNPSHDVYGINSKTDFKHFSCDSMIIDARIKPHHAPVLEKNAEVEKRIDQLFQKGGSLYGLIKNKS